MAVDKTAVAYFYKLAHRPTPANNYFALKKQVTALLACFRCGSPPNPASHT